MKIIVDELSFATDDCPFNHEDSRGYSLCFCRMNEDKCPMYWASEDNRPHECERFIEYDEFMRRTGRKSNG